MVRFTCETSNSIDQSDMIVSLVPELPGGVPGLSSGVERELQHAWEHTKEVYVVWKPAKSQAPLSPNGNPNLRFGG